MILVQQHLTGKQKAFKNHPFFQDLQKQNNFLEAMAFTPKLTFLVMIFQDVLKLLPPRIKTKELRRIATHHKIEDAGHDQWFLQDMTFLNQGKAYDIAWLFKQENERIRHLSYHILAEALTLSVDHLKILLILILESTGHAFFENMASFVKAKGYEAHLKYFSSYHLEVEHNHAIFEEKLNQALFSKELSSEERSQAITLIDQLYKGFNELFDHFYDEFLSKSSEKTYESEPLVA